MVNPSLMAESGLLNRYRVMPVGFTRKDWTTMQKNGASQMTLMMMSST